MRNLSRRTTAAMTALLIAAAALTGCSSAQQTQQTQQTSVQLTRVETQAASRGNLEITGTYIGTVASHNSIDVTPLVSGTVESVNVKVGDHVEAGDVLCRFDDKAAELQLQSAQDAVNTAKAGRDAAEDQISSAKKQSNVSVTSMEGQLKTLQSQRDSSAEQLEQLEASLPALEEGMNAASQAYTYTKQMYDSANALYIQFQTFLAANPDCATTAGLTAAAMANTAYPEVGELPAAGATSVPETADPAAAAQQAAEAAASQVSAEKQQIAAALLQALNEIPMSVEYLSEAGLSTLKEQAEEAESANASASSAYTSASSSISQLESAIEQLDIQIETLQDNIDATKDAADSAGGTDVYDAQIQAAETGVESAQYQKDLYTVTAPISGIIEAVNVTEHELSAQGYPAFTISDKEAMQVSFYVPEDVRDYLEIGDEIRIEQDSGTIKGSVSSIGTAVDPQKGLFKIDATITTVTDKSLLSNTSVSLTLVTNSVENEIMIPFDAVYYDNDQAYVFVAEQGEASEKAVRRDVTAGAYNNEMIVILEGLSEGDRVITTWGAGLKDGAAIEVINTGNNTGNDAGSNPGTGTQSDTQTP